MVDGENDTVKTTCYCGGMDINRQTKFEELPEWVAPAELSQWLGLGKSTVYQLIETGQLPSQRFGRRRFIPKEALRPSHDGASAA